MTWRLTFPGWSFDGGRGTSHREVSDLFGSIRFGVGALSTFILYYAFGFCKYLKKANYWKVFTKNAMNIYFQLVFKNL